MDMRRVASATQEGAERRAVLGAEHVMRQLRAPVRPRPWAVRLSRLAARLAAWRACMMAGLPTGYEERAKGQRNVQLFTSNKNEEQRGARCGRRSVFRALLGGSLSLSAVAGPRMWRERWSHKLCLPSSSPESASLVPDRRRASALLRVWAI